MSGSSSSRARRPSCTCTPTSDVLVLRVAAHRRLRGIGPFFGPPARCFSSGSASRRQRGSAGECGRRVLINLHSKSLANCAWERTPPHTAWIDEVVPRIPQLPAPWSPV